MAAGIQLASAALVMLAALGCSGSGGGEFKGSYEGDGVNLVLKAGTTGYTGELSIRGQTFPVEAAATGNTLAGKFKSGGESFELTATLRGGELELVSGGQTYRLRKAGAGGRNPLAEGAGDKSESAGNGATAAPASPFAGRFTGSVQGTAATASFTLSGDNLTGTIDVSGYVYKLTGTASGASSQGTFVDPKFGKEVPYEATVSGGTLSLKVSFPGAPPLELQMTRAGQEGKQGASAGTPTTATAGERNPALVGIWTRTESMSGGGGSFVSKQYLEISGNGQFRTGAGQTSASGSGVSISGGDGVEITGQGQWKTQGKIILVNEGGGWAQFARYYVEPGKLMFTFGDGSRQIWHRSQ